MTSQQSSTDQLSPRAAAVWRGLLRVHAHVVGQQNADLEEHVGLSVTEWEVLRALATAPDGQRRIRDIAGLVLLTSAGVTRLVNRLAGRGLLARAASEGDGRGTSVILTEAGREVYDRARPTDLLRELVLDKLTDEQGDQLIAAWEAILPGAATADDDIWARRRRTR